MAPSRPIDLDAIPPETHERFMRLAIEQARKNPAFPFGAVIVRMHDEQVLAAAWCCYPQALRPPPPSRPGDLASLGRHRLWAAS